MSNAMCAGQSYQEQFAAFLAQCRLLGMEIRKESSRLRRHAIWNARGLEKATQGLIPSVVQVPFVDRKHIAAAIEQLPLQGNVPEDTKPVVATYAAVFLLPDG